MIDLHSPSRTPTPPPNLNEKELNSTVCVEWECSRFKLLVCLLDQIARFLFFSRYHQRKELHFRTVKRKIPARKKSSQIVTTNCDFSFRYRLKWRHWRGASPTFSHSVTNWCSSAALTSRERYSVTFLSLHQFHPPSPPISFTSVWGVPSTELKSLILTKD